MSGPASVLVFDLELERARCQHRVGRARADGTFGALAERVGIDLNRRHTPATVDLVAERLLVEDLVLRLNHARALVESVPAVSAEVLAGLDRIGRAVDELAASVRPS